jgi:phosphoribosylglycinamide formyltransferase-1
MSGGATGVGHPSQLADIVRRVSERLPIAVLVSGTGTNLQALLDTVHGREAQVVAVASSVAGAKALERAERRGVPAAVFARPDYDDRAARDEALADWLHAQGARLIVLAGYMELLGGSFLSRFAGAVINVHPSLLPAFPGLDAIGQALAYGVQVFGVTVHFVDEGVDTGPVILQRAVELPAARSEQQVLGALRPLEHALLPEAVRLFARGELVLDPADPRRPLRARAGASADDPSEG